MNTFTAAYHGTCEACGGRIEPGDEVIYVASAVEHATCEPTEGRVQSGPLVPGPLELRNDVCPDCREERAASGACSCE